MQVGDAITKVQNDVLKKCDDVYKGQRYKGFIKFDYETNVVTINVSKYVVSYILNSDKLYKLFWMIMIKSLKILTG